MDISSSLFRAQEHKCPYCNASFSKKSSLTNHINRSKACKSLQFARNQAMLDTITRVDYEDPDAMPQDDPPLLFGGDVDHPLSGFSPNPLASQGIFIPFPDSDQASTQTRENEDAPIRVPRIQQAPISTKNSEDIRIEKFPHPVATPIALAEPQNESQIEPGSDSNPWHPFQSKAECELAIFLMRSNLSQGNIQKFLELDMTRNQMLPSFNGKRQFLQKVDSLPTGPGWTCHTIEIIGTLMDSKGTPRTEQVDLWSRDPVECIKTLLANQAFDGKTTYAPIRQYAVSPPESDDEDTAMEGGEPEERLYNEMSTGDWWWETQMSLHKDGKEGALVVPIILSSDKTQLSTFSGDKQAWPVYISIGNIDKDIRRKPSNHATMLLAYLPVTKHTCFPKKRRGLENNRLFHDCMRRVLGPLYTAGKDGVQMKCPDRLTRLGFPIVASYMGDYPELCGIACCKENTCPGCLVPPANRQDNADYPYRNMAATLKAIINPDHTQGNFQSWGLRNIPEPFWSDLPYTDIFKAFTPDILHQLHKGVFKDHLVSWCSRAANANEIDQRFMRIPPHPAVRRFKKGISLISQWTGREYKHMEKLFIGVIAGAVDSVTLKSARGVLDFIYGAHLPSHSTSTLAELDGSLKDFHDHKHAFVDNKVRDHFNIYKIHCMRHYVSSIKLFGSADGYNTEISERLHIDFAKKGYRASNRRDFISQMCQYLTRMEAIQNFEMSLQAKSDDTSDTESSDSEADSDTNDNTPKITSVASQIQPGSRPTGGDSTPRLKTAKYPAYRRLTVQNIVEDFGATDFLSCLSTYLQRTYPQFKRQPSADDHFGAFKKISIKLESLQGMENKAQPTLRYG